MAVYLEGGMVTAKVALGPHMVRNSPKRPMNANITFLLINYLYNNAKLSVLSEKVSAFP